MIVGIYIASIALEQCELLLSTRCPAPARILSHTTCGRGKRKVVRIARDVKKSKRKTRSMLRAALLAETVARRVRLLIVICFCTTCMRITTRTTSSFFLFDGYSRWKICGQVRRRFPRNPDSQVATTTRVWIDVRYRSRVARFPQLQKHKERRSESRNDGIQ